MTEAVEIRGSGREPGKLQAQLSAWFEQLLPGADPVVSSLAMPDSNGMSSDTVLFDLESTDGGRRSISRCVARIAPDPASVPVFAEYDLPAQFRVMQIVAEQTDVPVPRPRWLEPGAEAVGAPFFVMDRVDGRVPPDVMPYNFGSWLSEAEVADQEHLVEATIDVLARIHKVTPATADLGFLECAEPGDTALRRHVAAARTYYEWATGDTAIPLLEQCFDWLGANWPADESPTVLLWGDARIGNVLYDGFDPVAVLDWEMAGVGPCELDLAWGIFLHRFFEDIAADAGVDGMSHFLRLDDVVAAYERSSGHTPHDMRFYLMYSALRHGIVMSRIHLRQVHLGLAEIPDDPADMVLHRRTLEGMLDGSYWGRMP